MTGIRSARPRARSSRSAASAPGLLSGVRLGPLPPGGVRYGEPGQVPGGVLGLGLGLRPRASASLAHSGYVSARSGRLLEVGFPLADLGLDVGRGQGHGPVVLVHAASSSPWPIAFSRAASSGSCQGPHGRAERLGQVCALPDGSGPIACAGSVIPAASR